MNNAQLTGMRTLWEKVSVCKATKTAKEMALTSHTLNRGGDLATLSDGSVWVWDSRFDHWALWKR